MNDLMDALDCSAEYAQSLINEIPSGEKLCVVKHAMTSGSPLVALGTFYSIGSTSGIGAVIHQKLVDKASLELLTLSYDEIEMYSVLTTYQG